MLPLAVLAVCLSASLSAPTLDPQLNDHWNLWKSWHSKKYHEVEYCFLFFMLTSLSDLPILMKGLIVFFPLCLLFLVEGGGVEEDGLGEELEEDRAAQPGALLRHTLLPPGHEPLW